MPFPAVEYFSIEEVAGLWQIPEKKVRYYIYHHGLEACCWFDKRRVIYHEDDIVNYPDHYSGYAGIYVDDCRRIFRPGDALLKKFYVLDDADAWFYIEDDHDSALIHPSEVFIRSSACREFETRCNISAKKSSTLLITDEHHFYLDGEPLSFGPTQERVMHIYAKADKRRPWLHGANTLYRAGSKATRMRDLFKGNTSWKKLLESDRHGNFRLRENITVEYRHEELVD